MLFMKTLDLQISGVKNIKNASLRLPFENGVYTFVGSNGSGKSTVLLCLSQLLSHYRLNSLTNIDIEDNAKVGFSLDSVKVEWTYDSTSKKWRADSSALRFRGLYEGSLFYGTRFEDSSQIERLVLQGEIDEGKLADADDYVKDKMSYILHGDTTHYRTLKRIRNREIAKRLSVTNIPYFIKVEKGLVNQYKMSSGECLLVSLLHFLYNSIVRKSLPPTGEVLVLIDELELALHPIAIARLMEYLSELTREHKNLIVYLSSHSPEVIRSQSPRDLFKIENIDGSIKIENNCYPSYLIRDLYSSVSPDFLFLVEDKLAQLFVEGILRKGSFRSSKLIHCVPVGGWQNVLQLQKELYMKKILGNSTKIVSILDGDVENKLNKEQKKFPHLFLPISNIEDFMFELVEKKIGSNILKAINDDFFIVKSLSEIYSEYNKNDNRNAKGFYKCIVKELNEIGTSESLFIEGLSDIIAKELDVSSFVTSVEKILSR